jgi:hypothetical protein
MKTRNLLLTLGAVTLAAITFTATANDALLSPRAAGNQVKTVAGVNNNVNLVNTASATVSPRALANQTKTVAGTNGDMNPATLCAGHMTGGPKAIQACAANLGNMPCCTVAAAK